MRLSQWLVIAVLLMGGAVRAEDAPAAGAPMNLAGTWKGVFTYDVGVYTADLALTDANGGQLTGELHFKSLVMPPERARVLPPIEGTWKVTAKVEEGSRTVTITPGAGARQPPQNGVPTQTLAAVYVAGRDELAGHMLTRIEQPGIEHHYFLFARAGDAADRAKAVEGIQKLAEHAALTMAPPVRVNRRPARGEPARAEPTAPAPEMPDRAAVKAWIARYETEYPGSVQRDAVDKLGAKGMPLLNDATFKPVFGEAYDAIDPTALRQIIQAVTGIGPPGFPKLKGDPDPSFAREYAYIQYILKLNAQRVIAVAAMREIDEWEAQALERFKKESPTAHTFDDMAATQKAIAQRVAYAWPSDVKRTNDAFEELRTTSSGSTLTASADKAIESATGLAGAKALAGWAKQNGSALAHAPGADRTAVLQKINAALDKLLVTLLQRSEGELANLGTGRAALQAGVQWRAVLTRDFAFAADRPPVIELQKKLIARRTKDLTDAQSALLEQVSVSKSQADLDLVFSRDIPFEGDKASAVYTAVASAAKQRQAKIEEDHLMSMFSKDEQDMMDRPGHINVSKYTGYAPSPEEVRLALLRGYAFGDGKMIDAFTARHGGVIYPINVHITEVRIQQFIPIEGTKDFAYRVKLTWKFDLPNDNVFVNYDANTRKGSDLSAQLTAAVANALDDDYDYKLRLYDDGWGVPELRAAGAADGVMTQFLKGEVSRTRRGR